MYLNCKPNPNRVYAVVEISKLVVNITKNYPHGIPFTQLQPKLLVRIPSPPPNQYISFTQLQPKLLVWFPFYHPSSWLVYLPSSIFLVRFPSPPHSIPFTQLQPKLLVRYCSLPSWLDSLPSFWLDLPPLPSPQGLSFT